MSGHVLSSLVLILFAIAAALSPTTVPPDKSCREHPQLIGKCFAVRGRLSVYNGTPAIRLWRIGTRRMLGVSEQRFKLPGYRNLPENLQQQLNGDNQIVGDFLVCPFTKPKPSEMQLVCVESAKNVSAQKRKQLY